MCGHLKTLRLCRISMVIVHPWDLRALLAFGPWLMHRSMAAHDVSEDARSFTPTSESDETPNGRHRHEVDRSNESFAIDRPAGASIYTHGLWGRSTRDPQAAVRRAAAFGWLVDGRRSVVWGRCAVVARGLVGDGRLRDRLHEYLRDPTQLGGGLPPKSSPL